MQNYIKTILILILLLSSQLSIGQRFKSQDSSFGIYAGHTTYGIGVLANYNLHISRNSYIQGGLLFSFNSEEVIGNVKVPFDIFSLQAAYMKTYNLDRFDDYILNVGIGGHIGYEIINKGRNELDNGTLLENLSEVLYGPYVTAELEYSIKEDWSILLKSNLYYHPRSSLGDFLPYIGVGIRFYTF